MHTANATNIKTALLGNLKHRLIIAATAVGLAAPLIAGVGVHSAAACDLGDLLQYGCERPGTPQNVHSTASTDALTIQWDRQDGNWGYLTANLHWSANGKDQAPKTFALLQQDRLTLQNLSYGTTYCYSVQLVGANNLVSGFSDWNCDTTLYPPLSLPNTPAPVTPSGINPFNLHLVASDTAYVEIGWNYTANKPDYFAIYRDGKPAGTVQPFATQEYAFTDVFTTSPSHTYSYKVCAAFSRGDLGPIENCTEAQVKTGLNLTSVLSSTSVQLNGNSAIQAALGILPIVTPTPPPPGH